MILNIYMAGLCLVIPYWFIMVFCTIRNLSNLVYELEEEFGPEVNKFMQVDKMMTVTLWSSFMIYLIWPVALIGILISGVHSLLFD